ncbi:methyltransferase domain protein [Lyngbya aestuarii BL J]|uniref:Methyltransferase domain protein n=1 Tax=Lyngbya aestuarii BL J TaxID=1348334 RepID=U7QBM5_9CYAN|nr:class I SAM-dependent methyltransferase [Lyngbya aestuarii]ERT05233.1 methyltransferase domain protein [Lyngbya aestuarii BL J]
MNVKIKPDWAGGDVLSQLVNVLIKTPPIYSVMKHQARQVLIKTAEKNGIPWRKHYQQLEASEVKKIFSEINDKNIIYPDYYHKPFHAYDAGNLCWKAAFEAESATYSMGLRVWKNEKISWETAHERLRYSFHQVLNNYLPKSVNHVLDIGCSVGVSTRSLHHYLKHNHNPNVQTMGLDLSPYMLAVAKHQDTQADITWKHANAEKTDFPDDFFDVVTLQFLIHELPRQATRNIFQEALRILRPGGCLALVDNNPKSPVIQNLPPVLFTLMKSTEPWSDDYYTFEVEAALKEIGFEYKTTVASDPRHRTIIGIKP